MKKLSKIKLKESANFSFMDESEMKMIIGGSDEDEAVVIGYYNGIPPCSHHCAGIPIGYRCEGDDGRGGTCVAWPGGSGGACRACWLG